MTHARKVIEEAYPDCRAVFGGHGDYGGHRAPRDHTISFRIQDKNGKFQSNVIWLMPEELNSLTPGAIRYLVDVSNGKK